VGSLGSSFEPNADRDTLGSTGYRIAVDVATKWVEHRAGV
jgi:hypothetical protein